MSSLICCFALQTINLAAICTPADYNTRPLDTIYSNFIDALPVVCIIPLVFSFAVFLVLCNILRNSFVIPMLKISSCNIACSM